MAVMIIAIDDWRLWTVLGVVHVPYLIVPIIYWRCRDLDPIKYRRPRLLAACAVSTAVVPLHQVARNLFSASLGAWWDVVLGPALFITPIEAFFLFSLSLYLAFNKTRDQLRLTNRSAFTNAEFERAQQSIARKNLVLTDTFALVWIAVNVLVVQAAILIYAAVVDFSGLGQTMVGIEDHWSLSYCKYIIIGRMLITVIMFVALTFKLRMVEDAFGSKRMLRRVGLGSTLGAVLYMLSAGGSGLPQIAVILTCDWVLLQAFVIPVYRLYRNGGRTRAQYGSGVSAFERFLRTEAGFAAFHAHLVKEFAVESLLFWRDAQQFRRQFPQYADGGCRAALDIYNRYLAVHAPLEINVSSRVRAAIQAVLADGVLFADMFDVAAAHMVLLMEVNSMFRFLNTAPPSWEQFVVQDRADYLMSDQAPRQVSITGRPTKLSIAISQEPSG